MHELNIIEAYFIFQIMINISGANKRGWRFTYKMFSIGNNVYLFPGYRKDILNDLFQKKPTSDITTSEVLRRKDPVILCRSMCLPCTYPPSSSLPTRAYRQIPYLHEKEEGRRVGDRTQRFKIIHPHKRLCRANIQPKPCVVRKPPQWKFFWLKCPRKPRHSYFEIIPTVLNCPCFPVTVHAMKHTALAFSSLQLQLQLHKANSRSAGVKGPTNPLRVLSFFQALDHGLILALVWMHICETRPCHSSDDQIWVYWTTVHKIRTHGKSLD